ncbi:MAG: peptidylprolyl isomerase [Nitrospirota bacterium]|nr:peptidylprolyl isomerase [Nitrospirota bacterium]
MTVSQHFPFTHGLPMYRRAAWLRLVSGVFLPMLLLGAVACAPSRQDNGAGRNQNAKPPIVRVETSDGTVEFELLLSASPNSASTAAAEVLEGVYDGQSFYQVVPGMFATLGSADPTLALLPGTNQLDPPQEPLDRGMVALGWVGNPQRLTHRLIFVLSRLDPALDKNFQVFGRVTAGLDVLDRATPQTTVFRASVGLSKPTFRIRTAKGNIIIEMIPDIAPRTVDRITTLVCQGFYNNLTFHRVETVLIQGGDPIGDGSGGSGQTIPAELSNYRFLRGVVGMARQASDLDSADSQFFITKDTVRQFDGAYTVFGKVISGMDVVDLITAGDVMQDVSLQSDLEGRNCTTTTLPPTTTPPP